MYDLITARDVVKRHLKPTPLIYYRSLSDLIGADIYIKHENTNPTNSFKVRGGLNLFHSLSKNGYKKAVTFSTGNHGLSVAYSADTFGIEAKVVVPKGSNKTKIALIEDLGAEVIEYGKTFEEASKKVEEIVKYEDAYFVHPANEPMLIEGVASEFLEIYEDLPDVDTVILPLGGGSEVAAAVKAREHLKTDIDIIAVQAQMSQAAYLSWKQQKIVSSENKTFAGGFATGIGYEIPFNIYKNAIKDFVLLSEEEIYKAISLALEHTPYEPEGAGASTIMAAYKIKDKIKGKTVVLQMSGANPSKEEIETAKKR